MSAPKRVPTTQATRESSFTDLPADVLAAIAQRLSVKGIVALSKVSKNSSFLTCGTPSVITESLWAYKLRQKLPQLAHLLGNFSHGKVPLLFQALYKSKFSIANVAWFDKKHKKIVSLRDEQATKYRVSNEINEFWILHLKHINQRTRWKGADYQMKMDSPFRQVVHFSEAHRLQIDGIQRVRLPGVYRVVWRVALSNDYQLKEPIIFTSKVLPEGVKTIHAPQWFEVMKDDEPELEEDIIDETVKSLLPRLGRFEWELGPKTGTEYIQWQTFRTTLANSVRDILATQPESPDKTPQQIVVKYLEKTIAEQNALIIPAGPPQAQAQANPFHHGGPAAQAPAAAAALAQPGQPNHQVQVAAQVAAPQLSAEEILRRVNDPRSRVLLATQMPPMEKLFDLDVGRIHVPSANQFVHLSVSEPSADWSYGISVDYVQLIPEFEDPSLVELPLLRSVLDVFDT